MRSSSPNVRNPLIALPSAGLISSLPLETRTVLASLLGEISKDAAIKAESSWRKSKGPMAAYWKAVSVYAKHAKRLCKSQKDAA